MRIAALGATVLFALAACSSTSSSNGDESYLKPNSLMSDEISRRIEQVPFQHRDELLQNLLWLEQTIPAVLQGLRHDSPKVRSSCAWVLGRIRDRRTIPALQAAVRDSNATVKLECARSLVLLGDLAWSPALIEGLDSERKEVRYLCHEALKTATGHDFGYDHLADNQKALQMSVLKWRQWWSEYSGDQFFAQGYQQKNGLADPVAAPMGETKAVEPQDGGQAPRPMPENQPAPGTEPVPAPDEPKTEKPGNGGGL
jgi:hypothetical protein